MSTSATPGCVSKITRSQINIYFVTIIIERFEYRLPVIQVETPATPGHAPQIVFVLLATFNIKGHKAKSKQVGTPFLIVKMTVKFAINIFN